MLKANVSKYKVSTTEDEYVGKKVRVMEVLGKRRRGRLKWSWLDNIRNDLSERQLSGEEAQDPGLNGGV